MDAEVATQGHSAMARDSLDDGKCGDLRAPPLGAISP